MTNATNTTILVIGSTGKTGMRVTDQLGSKAQPADGERACFGTGPGVWATD